MKNAIIRKISRIILLSSFMCSVVLAIPGKVALIHFNPTLSDLHGNIASITPLVQQALQHGANIVVTPELTTTGFSITREQVVDSLGIVAPYGDLSEIRNLSINYSAYVLVGIAELTQSGQVYNTVLVFRPNGQITTQQKRSLSGWHERGTLPFDTIQTPYGDIGTMVCSDTWLPDWSRIVSLKGADIILLPANWWGPYAEEEIWQTIARENGVWFCVANRWGSEIDNRWGFPYTYDMSDAPSVFIDATGEIKSLYRANLVQVPHDTIIYQTVTIPQWRIGNALNTVYSANNRRPSAYQAIANTYYRPDLGNIPIPGLPAPGSVRVASMAYRPSLQASANLTVIEKLLDSLPNGADAIVLPGLGFSPIPVDYSNPFWYRSSHWQQLQAFVDQHSIQLLVTSVIALRQGNPIPSQAILVMKANQPPMLSLQIHDALLTSGTGQAPLIIDLNSARVGIVLGRDALFPEISTQLAKSGVDIMLVTSTIGRDTTGAPANCTNYFWSPEALVRMWKTRTNHVFHLAASDCIGTGVLVDNGGGFINSTEIVDSLARVKSIEFNSSLVRYKFLNAYYDFDLASILGSN